MPSTHRSRPLATHRSFPALRPTLLPTLLPAALCAASVGLADSATADVRDVQIVHVDVVTAVVTIRNLGETSQPLASFRLCTADDDQQLQYTTGGLGGVELDAGAEFRFHFNGDAPAGDPAAIDVGALGGFVAQPLDAGPFGLALYHSTPFSIGANMADYLQWTDDLANPGNLIADARGGTATGGGLWTGADHWIVTDPETVGLELLDVSGAELHGPKDYGLVHGASCAGDLDRDGSVGVTDLLAVLGDWGCVADCDGDADGDGMVGIGDLLTVLGAWGPCV